MAINSDLAQTMATFAFPIPTTGSISFSDFVADPSNTLAVELSDATACRASLRGILKQERRTDDTERDARAVVNAIEAYLPMLSSVVNCLGTDDLLIHQDPPFSWRATLTHSVMPNPSRLSLSSFHAEHTFVLLTYMYALANLSTSLLLALNPTTNPASRSYELDPTLSSTERKKKDERLGQAADLLCRAAGVGEWMGERIVGEWERERSQKGGGGKGKGPVEGSKSFVMGLSKMLLADAQLLSIRKLLAPSVSSTPHPGPPLSKTHPSPSLLSKLYLEVHSLYTAALTLAQSSSSSASSSSGSVQTDDPLPALVHYLKEGRDFSEAMSRKWLGVDAGESSGGGRTGEAIVWLRDAKKTLVDSSSSSSGTVPKSSVGSGGGLLKKLGGKGGGKEERKERKGKLGDAIDSVGAFLQAYEKANNQVYFSPLPPLSSLLARIPAGRAVLASKPFSPPPPAFGPGTAAYVPRSGDVPIDIEGVSGSLSSMRVGDDKDRDGEGYY